MKTKSPYRFSPALLISGFLLFLNLHNVSAQDVSVKRDSISDSGKQAKIVVSDDDSEAKDGKYIDTIWVHPVTHRNAPGFGDRIEVHGNFTALWDPHKAVVLFMDDKQLAITGERISDSVINFKLSNEKDKDFWTAQFFNAQENRKKDSGRVHVDIAVGLSDGSKISNAFPFEMEIYRPNYITFTWAIFVGVLLFLMFLGSRTDILRENCECNCPPNKKAKKPFSLGRVQMAFWTAIVSFSFIYIYFASGYMPDVTDTTLILLGISSATTVSGYIIDTNTANNDPTERDNNCCSLGFFRDIVSDYGVPGIHRFQNVIFTLILGIIYVYQVIHNLQMSDFGTNMLVLMGISNGAYLGIKFVQSQPKGNSAPQVPAVAPAPATQPVPQHPVQQVQPQTDDQAGQPAS